MGLHRLILRKKRPSLKIIKGRALGVSLSRIRGLYLTTKLTLAGLLEDALNRLASVDVRA